MANFYTLGILLYTLSVGLCVPLGCPSMEDMRPCTCKRVAYGLHVICAGFNNSFNLIKAFKILRDYKVQTVLLHGLYMNEPLPEDIFDGMKIKEIRVEQSKLVFDQPAFSGLDQSLNILNVAKHSVVKSENRFSLAKLSELTELSVQSNQLNKVHNNWLNGKIPNVHTIELDNNAIREIEDKAFESLTSLKMISLSQNQIQSVQRSMLPNPALKLERIDISFNEISELPSDFFYEMPSLKEVILTENKLTHLPESTWIPVWENLDKAILTRNDLVCDDSYKWIKDKRMPYLEANCHLPKELQGKSLRDVFPNT